MMTLAIAKLAAWWAAKKAALLFYGFVVAAFAAYSFYMFQWGKNVASAACEVAAKEAQIETLKIDLSLANARAQREAGTAKILGEMRAKAQERIQTLEKELNDAEARAKANTDGKPDPNAILDSACRYTPYGADRVRKR